MTNHQGSRYVALTVLALAFMNVARAAAPVAQPDDTLPGPRPGQIFLTSGTDETSPFSGEASIKVRFPSLPLGPNMTFEMAAVSTIKQYFFDASVESVFPGDPNIQHAFLSGEPTFGAGWRLAGLDYVRGAHPGEPSSWVYVGPDGAAHYFESGTRTSDGSDLRITAIPNVFTPTSFKIELPDGSVHILGQKYLVPRPVSGGDPHWHDFGEEAYNPSNIPSPTYRYGLTSIQNPFGATVLTVNYASPSSSSPDAWKVSTINLLAASVAKSIVFNWAQIAVSNESPTPITWDVLDSIVFPTAPKPDGSPQTLVVKTSFLAPNATLVTQFKRNVFDKSVLGGTPQAPTSTLVAAPLLTGLSFRNDAGVVLANYSFDYILGSTNGQDGLIRRLTLPTGGTVDYTFGTTAEPCWAGTAPCVDPETSSPAARPAVSAANPPFPFQNYWDASPAVIQRTETDPITGLQSTTTFARMQVLKLTGNPSFPLDTERSARVAIVTSPSGNTFPNDKIATRYIFHLDFGGGTNGSSGVELVRRHYTSADVTAAPARTIVSCLEGFDRNGFSMATGCGYWAEGLPPGDPNREVQRYVSWWHIEKYKNTTWNGLSGPGGGRCALSRTVPCWERTLSSWNAVAQEYSTETISIDRIPAPGQSYNPSILLVDSDFQSRTTTTTWTPNVGTIFLPRLFSQRTVTDSYTTGCPYAPCSVTTNFTYTHPTFRSFLTSVSVSDPIDGTRTTTFEADAKGNPNKETITVSGPLFDGSSVVTNRVYDNGVLIKSTRAGLAHPWDAFRVEREPVTGVITKSYDANGLATTYQYDAMRRLTQIKPPNEDPVNLSYTINSPNGPYMLIKKSATLPPSTLDDGVPLNGSGSWEAHRYDGFGRELQHIIRLPNPLEGPGNSYLAFRETRYNAAGLVASRSEFVPCSTVFGTTSASSCFITAAPLSTTTTFSNFDFLGRPRIRQAPDERAANGGAGEVTTISYDDISGVPNSDTAEIVTYHVDGQIATKANRKDILGRHLIAVEPGESQTLTAAPTQIQSLGFSGNYHYNVMDQLASVIQTSNGVTQTRTYVYSPTGPLKQETHPEKATSIYLKYNALGLVTQKSEAGILYTQTYDAAGRLTLLKADGIDYVANFYDGDGYFGGDAPLGKLTQRIGYNPEASSFENLRIVENFGYSASAGGRLTLKKTDVLRNSGAVVLTTFQSYTHNSLGLVADFTQPWPDPNPANRAHIVTTYRSGLPVLRDAGGGPMVTSATYKPNGSLLTMSYANGVTMTIDADPFRMARPYRIRAERQGSLLFDTGNYRLDAAGNILQVGNDFFHYFPDSKLKSASFTEGASDVFTYDDFGSMLTWTKDGVPKTFGVDPTTNRLTSPQVYDTRGNMTQTPGETLVYDKLNRQTQHRKDNVTERFYYDGAGERIVKIVSEGTSFYTLTPCRAVDTRNGGAPPLSGQTEKSFDVVGVCGIPANAKALALNLTALNLGAQNGYFRLFAAGLPYRPNTTVTASKAGSTRATHAIASLTGAYPGRLTIFNDLPLGTNGHAILDIAGYFAPTGDDPTLETQQWTITFRDDANRLATEYRWRPSQGQPPALYRDHLYFGNQYVSAQNWEYVQSDPPLQRVYFTTDHLGSPRLVTDLNGAVRATYKFRAYGQPLSNYVPMRGPDFCGMERDERSGNWHDHARVISAAFGRFNSPDKIGGTLGDPRSWNKFAYGRLNPLRFVDPDGLAEVDKVVNARHVRSGVLLGRGADLVTAGTNRIDRNSSVKVGATTDFFAGIAEKVGFVSIAKSTRVGIKAGRDHGEYKVEFVAGGGLGFGPASDTAVGYKAKGSSSGSGDQGLELKLGKSRIAAYSGGDVAVTIQTPVLSYEAQAPPDQLAGGLAEIAEGAKASAEGALEALGALYEDFVAGIDRLRYGTPEQAIPQ